MKFSPLILLLSVSTFAGEADPTRDQAIAANRRLEAWRQEEPEHARRTMHVVCWTPADRELPAEYATRLDGILKHIQAFYRNEMERHGFGRRSIEFALDDAGRIVLHAVRGKHPRTKYGKKSGRAIRDECRPALEAVGIDLDRETVVIFCNLADWNEKTLVFTHDSPYYAGGTNRGGTAWQLDSPELAIGNLPKKTPIIRDGQYGRISLGKHNSIFIGGIAHEIGHAIGLPHCTARPDEAVRGTVLMGSGNRTYGDELRDEGKGSVLSYAHALRLASHPQFSGSVKDLATSPTCNVTDLVVETSEKAIVVSGTVKGTPRVYGLVAYFDPEGRGDYDATTATAIPDNEGRFQLRTTALARGKSGVMRLIPLHCNGAIPDRRTLSTLEAAYEVDRDGVPRVSRRPTE